MCSCGENDELCNPSTEFLLPKQSFSPLKVIILSPENGHISPDNGHSEAKCAVEVRHLAVNVGSIN